MPNFLLHYFEKSLSQLGEEYRRDPGSALQLGNPVPQQVDPSGSWLKALHAVFDNANGNIPRDHGHIYTDLRPPLGVSINYIEMSVEKGEDNRRGQIFFFFTQNGSQQQFAAWQRAVKANANMAFGEIRKDWTVEEESGQSWYVHPIGDEKSLKTLAPLLYIMSGAESPAHDEFGPRFVQTRNNLRVRQDMMDLFLRPSGLTSAMLNGIARPGMGLRADTVESDLEP